MRSSRRMLSLLTASALALSAFSGFAVSAGAAVTETPFEPTAATYINSKDADTNFSESGELYANYAEPNGTGWKATGGEGMDVALVQFDVSEYVGQIIGATLSLTSTCTTADKNSEVNVAYTDAGWDASDITWNKAQEMNPVKIAAMGYAQSSGTNLSADVYDYVSSDEDGKLSFAFYTSTGRQQKIENVKLNLMTTDAAKCTYKIVYVDTEGEEIKEAAVKDGFDGIEYFAQTSDTGNFYVGDDYYVYQPDESTTSCIAAEDNSAEIRLVYQKLSGAVVVEDFSNAENNWGFTNGTGVSVADGILNLCTANGSGKTDTKDFDDSVKNMPGMNLNFKWKTSVDLGNTGGNRQSVFTLLDDEGNIIFAISGATNKSGIPTKVRYQVGGNVTASSAALADSNDWFTIDLNLDFVNKKVKGTITNGETVVTIEETSIAADCLAQLAAQNVSSLAPMAIDDVIITKGETSPVTFKVTSSEGDAALENAQIEIAGFTAVTNESGEAVMYLPDGEYTAQVTAAQHKNASADVKVEGSAAEVPVKMEYVGETPAAKIEISGGEENIYKPAEGENKTTIPFKATVYNTIEQEMPDETVTWSIPENVKGISIDENGIVTVTSDINFADDNGVDVKIRATSSSVPSVYAETQIHVRNVARLTSFDIVGSRVVKDNSSAEYSVANVKDQYSVEMQTYGTPVLTASEGIAVENMTITPALGVTNETSATVTVTIDGKAVTKDIIVYGYDFYEPGEGEASIGNPRMEEINGVKMIVWPASSASSTATYTMTLPEPVALANGTSKMLTFNTYYYDMNGEGKDVTVQERTMLVKNSKGDTLVRLGFANGKLYLNPTYSSSGITASEAEWIFNAEGVKNDETIVFATDTSGVTKATIQVNSGDTYTYEVGTDVGEIASIELFEGKGAPSTRLQAFTNVKISDSDIVPVEINGDNFISKIYGKEATKKYTASIFAQEEGETFSWSCVSASGQAVALSEETDEAAAVLNPVKTGTANAVIAVYADGRLDSVNVQTGINVTAGEPVTIKAPEGATVMLWNSLGEMEPMADAQISSADDTPATDEPSKPTEKPGEPTNPPASDVYIDADGVLHVPYTTTETAVEIRYSSDLDESKYATKVVEIRDYANVKSFDINGPAAITTGETGEYSVSNITDEYGDVVEMTPSYSIQSGSEYASIDPVTGVLTTNASGDVTIAVTLGNPGKELTLTKDVTVANFYYINKEVSGSSIEVDASLLANYTADTEYYVTTAANGEIVSQITTKAENGKINVDTTGATAVEVSPVYSYTNVGNIPDASPLVIPMPDGLYDFTFTKADGERGDIYVNGNMVGQNVDQYGNGRSSSGSTYTVKDVKVNGGSAVVVMKEKTSNMSSVMAKKAPSIVDRKQHIYILGDSLVSTYYGTFADDDGDGIPAPGDAQTGWGQVLDKFIKDSVNVTNLAESGNYAQGLYDSVFHSVINNSEPGDVLLFECGYNDKSYPKSMAEAARIENMKYYMGLAYNEAKAAGLNIVFVTPNGTPRSDGWKADVAAAADVREQCKTMGAPLIDLAALSWAINEPLGKDYVNANYIVNGDNLHSSYLGAMRHALTVAQAMYGMDELKDLVDTEASYDMVDSEGKMQEFKVNTSN